MKTIAYVDGFNLYYRLLRKDRQLRWLDLESFVRRFLDDDAELVAINYYTARVKGSIDRDAPRKQQLYFNALSSLPMVEIHEGNFTVHKTFAALVHPPQFNPELELGQEMVEPYPTSARVFKVEEKGSDVNLGSHLVRDAFQDKFDQAVIVTNDTDLCEPVRIVREEVGKPVGLLAPVDNPARSLKETASWVKHVKKLDAAACQFPDRVGMPNGRFVNRPESWIAEDE